MEKEEIKEMLEMVYEIMGDKKFAESIAKVYRNVFDALREKGFTSAGALQILISMQLGKGK